MDTQKYRQAVSSTISNLIRDRKSGVVKDDIKSKPESLDMGGFLSACKQEFVSMQIPIYELRLSDYRDNVIVVELPFCSSCEIAINTKEFGMEDREVVLFIDKKAVRKIAIKTYDASYMTKVAKAIVDYFKRYMLLKNRFEE